MLLYYRHTLTSEIVPGVSAIAHSLGEDVNVLCAAHLSNQCRAEGPASCKEAGGNTETVVD